MDDDSTARLRVADDLHLTWRDHLVSVGTSRYEPGVFLYDIAYLTVEARPGRGRVRVRLASRGESVDHQVLRFEVDEAAYPPVERFFARVRAHRDRLRG